MTETVVQRLEVVDVDHEQAEVVAISAQPTDLALEEFLEKSTVVELRQGIGHREI